MTKTRFAILRIFCRDEAGATVVEYAFIAGIIAVMLAAALPPVAAALSGIFTAIANALS